jgi:hypothetical protein
VAVLLNLLNRIVTRERQDKDFDIKGGDEELDSRVGECLLNLLSRILA